MRCTICERKALTTGVAVWAVLGLASSAQEVIVGPRAGGNGGAGSPGKEDSELQQPWQYEIPETTLIAHGRDFRGAWVAAGDINGDGFDDLVVSAAGEDHAPAGYDEGGIYVYDGFAKELMAHLTWNNSVPRETLEVGTAVTTGDFNGDGFADVACEFIREKRPPYGWGTFVWYGPDLQVARELVPEAGGTPKAFDLNQDGFDDLLFYTNYYKGLGVFLGPQLEYSYSVELQDPQGMVGPDFDVADFDADGAFDLVIPVPLRDEGGAKAVGGVWILWGPDYSNQKFLRDTTPRGGGGFGHQVAVGDINLDGFPDLFASPRYTSCDWAYVCGEVHLFYGPRLKDRFIISDPHLEVPPNIGSALAVADIHGDGALDLITWAGIKDPSEPSLGACAVLRGPDLKGWEFIFPKGDGWSDGTVFSVSPADVNRDQRSDLLFGQPQWRDIQGRGVLWDFASRDEWFELAWDHPPGNGLHLSVDTSRIDEGEIELVIDSPESWTHGILIGSNTTKAVSLSENGFDGSDPTTEPAVFPDLNDLSLFLPFVTKKSGTGSQARIPVRFDHIPGASSYATAVYFQAFVLSDPILHSRAVAVPIP